VLELPLIFINGGQRGYLVGLDPKVLVTLLGARPVQCAIGGPPPPPGGKTSQR
jgi:prolyl-tRNA editing enzyme YbaK/EbsC (Cys-tRNA(Pro) deacylase)